MTITLDPRWETILKQLAQRQGVPPETIATSALERFLRASSPIVPRDEWEQRLLAAGSDCGVSLSNEALGSEGLYE